MKFKTLIYLCNGKTVIKVNCVEEWSRRQLLDPATIQADLTAEDYLLVGQYAVQFLWSDAHYTGIYPFDLLRKLCPCEDCGELPE